ncbi:hypothetical protein F5890DRAFT_1627893 [Lentinula detonsa]|uniref:NAD(P)-binding protein n=1 Tax=Lentinula detonsa TaxID=2804962 RepID=A0AA38PRD3_9AGAR|nr:hypothetical protein F5890DRAFT_1627893 [Lentinula detonsa]
MCSITANTARMFWCSFLSPNSTGSFIIQGQTSSLALAAADLIPITRLRSSALFRDQFYLTTGQRASVRSERKRPLSSNNFYESHQSQLEVMIVNDISTSQFPEALKGTKAIINTCSLGISCFRCRGSVEDKLTMINQGAVEGALNVLRQAEKAGVHKVVLTSTILTAFVPQFTFTTDDWFAITKEEALKNEGVKALNPPYLYGLDTKEFTTHLATPSNALISTLISTFINIYKPLNPNDVAKAHTGALVLPPTSNDGQRRIQISSPHNTVFADIVKFLNEKRPELKDRLTKTTPPEFPFKKLAYDSKRVEEILGLKPEHSVPADDTFIESVDTLVGLENQWEAAGYELTAPQYINLCIRTNERTNGLLIVISRLLPP